VNELQLHTLLEQAARHRDEGRVLHAIQILTNLMRVQPSCDKVYAQLAQLYLDMNRPEQAEKVLLHGAAANKENLEYNLLLGNLHLRQQQFERALQYFGNLKHLNIPQIHQSIGLIYFCQGNLEAAEAELRRAVASDPDLPKVHELFGEVLLRSGKTDEAITAFMSALKRDPYSSIAHRLLGEAYVQRKEFEQAYGEFTQAIDCNPDDFALWFLCGTTLAQLQRYDEARAYLEHAYKMNSKSEDVLSALAYIHLKLGENALASETFDAALALEPNRVNAKQLSEVLLRTNPKN
jgi:tetratricopeptide (TPR) repeat protein